MAYVDPDFKTKRELKEAIASGRELYTYSPGPFPCKRDGDDTIEGPHYPKAHSWYARVRVADGKIVKFLS